MSNEVSRQVYFEKKMLITKIIRTEITFSVFELPSTSDDYDINTGDYKSTHLWHTKKTLH